MHSDGTSISFIYRGSVLMDDLQRLCQCQTVHSLFTISEQKGESGHASHSLLSTTLHIISFFQGSIFSFLFFFLITDFPFFLFG